MPFYLRSAVGQGSHPIPSPSVVFIFGLVVESIKELGGVSTMMHFFWKVVILFGLCVQTTMVLGVDMVLHENYQE
jgi:hypothetical protein